MSILSTAILTASLVGASCMGAAAPNAAPVSADCNHKVCASVSRSCQQDGGKWMSVLGQYGVSPDSNQCIVIRPGADNKPQENNKPGIDNPQNPGGGQENNGDSGQNESQSSYAAQVVALVNAERAKYNLAPLQTNSSVSDAALTRAKEIVTSFSHTRPDGSSFSTALKEHGVSYRGYGENIAWGQKTPEEVVSVWMNSAGHRANILHESFTDIGVGYHVQNGKAYWVQLFTY